MSLFFMISGYFMVGAYKQRGAPLVPRARGIQMLFAVLPLGPVVKFVAVTALGLPVVFAWSWLVRRAPAVRAVL